MSPASPGWQRWADRQPDTFSAGPRGSLTRGCDGSRKGRFATAGSADRHPAELLSPITVGERLDLTIERLWRWWDRVVCRAAGSARRF